MHTTPGVETTLPPIRYPPELPITARRADLVELLANEQVLVVAGETGSGKSTQLPKLCLEAGRGRSGLIGHTQPRRIAARAVAERVAEELGSAVGDLVGYTVRFTDEVGPDTRVKVMTDGILLNEIQRDPDLRAYDTLIVDEAHERSLNVDFILGYLRQLLERRDDLVVVITSATIDTQRFAQHYGGAPIVEVSGRSYPVEVRYRPFDEDGGASRDLVDAIVDAVVELSAEGPGDVLVFASGEREIRDASDALRAASQRHAPLSDLDVLPLYSRLSAAEQHRVFRPHAGRRVVVATNIAETSLTVPGIRYVVDPGTARISRSSRRGGVQRLPIEPVSRASADQRAGRCGRLGPGICIRLYSREDYESRPDFTEPEILRSNLASVVLQMTAIGLGDIGAFPFVQPPERRAVAAGVALLEELGAVTADPDAPGGRRLTPVGRRMARLPVDPRLARMVIEAEREGCVHEVMVVAAALSIQDVRERPSDRREQADQLHARFRVPGSDFLTVLELWRYVRGLQRKLSGNQFRRRCREEFLHHLRIREWEDVYGQLRRVVAALGIRTSRTGESRDAADAIHRAMLAGLLGNVGMREDGDPRSRSRDYLGGRGMRFRLGRESVLAKRPPAWVMAAELVETTGTWARTAAAIRPEWIEAVARDACTRSYSDPRWERGRGAATVVERVTFRGLVIVPGRRVPLTHRDPALARELFIRHALVEGDTDRHWRFRERNASRVVSVLELERRARRRDILAAGDVLEEFYAARVPEDLTSAAHFDRWWKKARKKDPGLLDVSPDVLVAADAAPVRLEDFPDARSFAGRELPLEYTFDPAAGERDGVTVELPLLLLPEAQEGHFAWLVPGLRLELVTELIRALPKQLRRKIGPHEEAARAVLQRTGPADGPLQEAVARELSRIAGVRVAPHLWTDALLPDHLRIRYRIVEPTGDGGRRVLVEGSHLGVLRAALGERARAVLAKTAGFEERERLVAWPGGDLPEVVSARRRQVAATGYPALVDTGHHVALRVLGSRAEQRRAMWTGTRRLLRLALGNPVRLLVERLDRESKLGLALAPHADVARKGDGGPAGGRTGPTAGGSSSGYVKGVVEDCTTAVLDELLAAHGGPVRTEEEWARLEDVVTTAAPARLEAVARQVAAVCSHADRLRTRLCEPVPDAAAAARDDMATQLARLVFPGFVSATGTVRLRHLPRYLQGIERRLDVFGRNLARDAERMAVVRELEADLRALRGLGRGDPAQLHALRWRLEELRVSLFAQSLGTDEPVSQARVRKALDALRE